MKKKPRGRSRVDRDLWSEVDRLLGKGRPRSLRACTDQAMRKLVGHERRIDLQTEMEEASCDKMFIADIRATMKDFKYLDAETARRMEKR